MKHVQIPLVRDIDVVQMNFYFILCCDRGLKEGLDLV